MLSVIRVADLTVFVEVDPVSATACEDTAPLATESAFDALIVIDARGFELPLELEPEPPQPAKMPIATSVHPFSIVFIF